MIKQHNTNPEIESRKNWLQREFIPHPLLMNRHLMTVVPGFLPRKVGAFAKTGKARLFQVNDETRVLGYCHWQNDCRQAPTVIILHGLEGSAESSHVTGIGAKAFQCGFNVVRLNMRNCGGSMMHARSLYNAGLYEDLHAVMQILHNEDGITDFMLAGYSLGGNLIISAAAHHDSASNYKIKAVCAVSPSVDLARAVDEIELKHNRIYQDWFLKTLKQKILAKSGQYPEIYKTDGMETIKTIREFDDRYTAPHGGYGNADNYYQEASSLRHIHRIKTRLLIITAEDDPLVPIETFRPLANDCPQVDLVITKNGGHGGFFQSAAEKEPLFDRFWAENRVVAYMKASLEFATSLT